MLNLFTILLVFVLFFIHAYTLEFRKFTKWDGYLSIGLLITIILATLNLFLTLIEQI
jgi:hypothetical protein